MKDEKLTKEFHKTVQKFLDDPKEMALQTFDKKHVKSMALVTTILTIERNIFRDILIEIRSQMDIPRSNMIQQTKRQLTKLIAELQ